MANLNESLHDLMTLDGAMCAAVVDYNSGMLLGSIGSGVDLELAAAGNTEVVRAKRRVAANLDLQDSIEDILITLSTQYHLIRPLETNQNVFLYLVLERAKSNLGLARAILRKFEPTLDFS